MLLTYITNLFLKNKLKFKKKADSTQYINNRQNGTCIKKILYLNAIKKIKKYSTKN